MFDQLVLSSRERRRHRTGKFFAFTATMYALAIAGAFVVSLVVSDPRLADTSDITWLPAITMAQSPKIQKVRNSGNEGGAAQKVNFDRVLDLEHISRTTTAPPVLPLSPNVQSDPGTDVLSGPLGFGNPGGVAQGNDHGNVPPPAPDPPRAKAPAQPEKVDNNPVRLISEVLQGKAIERPKPVYPVLAIQIHLQGQVSVEVIISPEGRVETARAVGGHPMLANAAVEAARKWRFEPTFLNKQPVRVTGVIVFVFRLGE